MPKNKKVQLPEEEIQASKDLAASLHIPLRIRKFTT